MSRITGPYHVKRIDTSQGPRWRLAGPGQDGAEPAKSYPWDEVREKLAELAELMNFAWTESRRQPHGTPSTPHTAD
jgi:hypothetical protein